MSWCSPPESSCLRKGTLSVKLFRSLTANRRFCWIFLLAIACQGCGQQGLPLTKVSGNVTLDGSPLEGAQVTFEPVSGERPSFGITNSSGNYSLKFTQDRPGGLPGEHIIRISTWTAPTEQSGKWTEGTTEKIPAYYNDKAKDSTDMRQTLKGSSTTINFAIDSKKGPLPNRPKLRKK